MGERCLGRAWVLLNVHLLELVPLHSRVNSSHNCAKHLADESSTALHA